jgi:hypothetical protein
MVQCPRRQSTNVVVTEEVFTRKGKVYYRFWQTVIVVLMVMFGVAIGDLALGFFLALGGGLLVEVFSLINAGKKATSRTKIRGSACNTNHSKVW